MKIHISNLGTIKHAQIDLKPLTVFVGDNGTNKTWVAYTIAGLLGPYGYRKYLDAYLGGNTKLKFQAIEENIDTLLNKGTVTIDLNDFLSNHAEEFINEVADLVPQWLNVFMATKRANFNATSIKVEFTPSVLDKIIKKARDFKVTAEFSIGKKDVGLLSLNALKEKNKEELYFYIKNKDDDIPAPVKNKEVREFVISVLFGSIHNFILSNTPIFPTERAAFITLPFLIVTNNSDSEKDESLEQDKIKIEHNAVNMALSEPVQYFRAMVTSSAGMFFDRKKAEQDEPKTAEFIKLSNLLETEILSGQVDFKGSVDRLELLYNPEENTSLELNISSSMVKGLASLSLYLKYLARQNDLVVIDEPEMNLHPVAQVMLTEFMGMLVNSGLNLLITTHSPYIVDHLANLMCAFKSQDKNEIKSDFYLERESAFISEDDVSIYLFEDGQVKTLISEDGEIDWGTFSDVSRSVSEIYSKLI